MKKIVLSAAIAATTLTFTACNSCGEKRQPALLVEAEVDSLYMVNDTTMADKQTFIFEGLMPMENGKPGNVLLAIESISLNDDGTYTVSTTYIDENANPEYCDLMPYYYVPCFFIDGVNKHEGRVTKEIVQKVLDEAMNG